MQNKLFVCFLTVLALLVFPFIGKSKTIKSHQEFVSMNFLELLRAGYDLRDNKHDFSEICHLLNDTLLTKEDHELRLSILTHILVIDDNIDSIDWGFSYNDNEIGPVSARRTFFIDISKNGKIKTEGILKSISNLQSLARDYIFYPDSVSKRLVYESKSIEGIGKVEVSLAAPIVNLHLPKKSSFSTSDWRFFFDCLQNLIELYEDERNKASLRIFNKDYLSLSFIEKEKIVDVVGYKIYIEIIR